jgi:hypothetical protein
MTVQVDFFTLIITVLFIIIAAVLIPALFQLKSTAKQIDDLVDEARRDLLPMLKELRQASERINQASDKAEIFFDSIGETGESIHRVNDFLQHDIGRYVGNAAGLWLGIRAASKVFIKQLKEQGGK